jgi:hypothetical protein
MRDAVSLEVPSGIHDMLGGANGPFARAKEKKWPIGKIRAPRPGIVVA